MCKYYHSKATANSRLYNEQLFPHLCFDHCDSIKVKKFQVFSHSSSAVKRVGNRQNYLQIVGMKSLVSPQVRISLLYLLVRIKIGITSGSPVDGKLCSRFH
jgi:hypothetical protein